MAQGLNRIGLMYRTDKKEAFELAKKLATWLVQQKKEVYSLSPKLPKVEMIKSAEKLDLVVVLGGDGTYLSAVRFLEGRPIPILGANFGHTGFLTETIAEDVFTVLEKVFKGKIKPTERAMLEAKFAVNGKKNQRFEALNEIVVERGADTHLIDMSIYHGKSLVSRFRADGLIVATPTGTTAYNLSASGPIIHANVPAIVVTPVCPHSLTARSITLPDDGILRVKLNRKKQRAKVMIDGSKAGDLEGGSQVEIRKSKNVHLMLSSDSYDYFERLNAKLQFGQRY